MSRNRRRVLASLALTLAAPFAAAQNQLWLEQLGTSSSDRLWAAAPDGSGGVVVGGSTLGSLGGPNAGDFDAWLARYDSAGNQLWIRQLGTSGLDNALAAVPDGLGGVVVAGHTAGNLGGPSAGGDDAWLARFDGAGSQLWIRQLGTSSWDQAFAAAPDGTGGVYINGSTKGGLGGPNAGVSDAWLARYDGAGNLLWIRQLGTSGYDHAFAAAQDASGGVYVGGQTDGSLGGPNAGPRDAWLARYDGAGNQLWIRQFGTSGSDHLFAAAPDGSGGTYVGGETYGSLGGPNAGSTDAWLARYDGAGNLIWTRQLGTNTEDKAYAAAPDRSGGAYVAGMTQGHLGGANAGVWDAWLARYDGAGNQLWVLQLGTSSFDGAEAAAVDDAGGVYFGGGTQGILGSASAGGLDTWLARYDGGCTTPATYCTAMVSSSGCSPTMGWIGAPSLSQAGAFALTAAQLEHGQNGLMFFGTTGPESAPFFGGWLCVKPTLHRLLIANSGGAAACQGALSYTLMDLINHPTGGPFVVPGQAIHAQAWTRDPPGATTVNLSNGLTFTVCP